MFNFLDIVKSNPGIYRQFSIGDQLITEFNCPLESDKETLWSEQGYFVYVLEGKKVWHVPGKEFDLNAGTCVFVKKGVHIVEQFFDTKFCVVVFFVSDQFICNTLRSHSLDRKQLTEKSKSSSIYEVDTDDTLHAFFNSVIPYFLSTHEVNKPLLELKFRELILNVINNPRNGNLTCFFQSLLTESHVDCMRKVLEENFQYNLGLEEYARICGRSLSAFKRDFEEHFNTTPGRWLLERRLQHAQLLINTSDKSISEIAYESGFENVSHFSKSFKQHFGNSPVNYRKAI
jgi:AraC-like DNA-binding protein